MPADIANELMTCQMIANGVEVVSIEANADLTKKLESQFSEISKRKKSWLSEPL